MIKFLYSQKSLLSSMVAKPMKYYPSPEIFLQEVILISDFDVVDRKFVQELCQELGLICNLDMEVMYDSDEGESFNNNIFDRRYE